MTMFNEKAIIRILSTEKSVGVAKYNTKIMLVDSRLNKIEIKKAVEALFSVKVVSVNTLNNSRKVKRMGMTQYKTTSYKKAYVTLSSDSNIDLSKGV